MINLDELPQDKLGKQIALNAIASQFLAMAALIATGDIKDEADIDFYCWSVIQDVEAKLDE